MAEVIRGTYLAPAFERAGVDIVARLHERSVWGSIEGYELT